eukprot:TRINITY_DN36467_c0_g1_i2.p1 TRINITY_DN36467_c0_g1~~TRINITY_DN36467_c0_g1_i2.p1  ORF type:complete len:445 (+),score=120.25 TRINITY_DN36467_c0_g1_i2:60-1394(+)
MAMEIDKEELRWEHVDKVLARHGPLEAEDFPGDDETRDYLAATRILVIGAGGLGCEVLKGLALSGFKDIEVIDNDTIDLSNLNRQFLFRSKDVGQPKATVAAEFVRNRVGDDIEIKPTLGLIQDQPVDWYRTFQIVVCGLDNVEARRWINDLLLSFVVFDEEGKPDMSTVIPLLDGGTEGFKGHSRVIIPGVTADMGCGPAFEAAQTYPLCTIKNTPRIPEHCIMYALEVMWKNEMPFGDIAVDTDDSTHMMWICEKATARGLAFNITGVTFMLTQGVVKNIIPAITSINAIIASSTVLEAFKLATNCYKPMDSFMMYNGKAGIYTYTYAVERLQDKGHPTFELAVVRINTNGEAKLGEILGQINAANEQGGILTYAGNRYPLANVSARTYTRRLYSTAPTLEPQDRPNLDRTLKQLGIEQDSRLFIESCSLPKHVRVWCDLSL